MIAKKGQQCADKTFSRKCLATGRILVLLMGSMTSPSEPKLKYVRLPVCFFTQSQVCRQEFCAWLANSWRPERGIARMSNQFKVKKPDLLWRTQKDRVLKEIASILGVTEATTNTPGWFTARSTAMKNILQGMSAVEKKAFDEEIKGIQKQGYEPDVQRRYITCNVKGAGLNAGVHQPRFQTNTQTRRRIYDKSMEGIRAAFRYNYCTSGRGRPSLHELVGTINAGGLLYILIMINKATTMYQNCWMYELSRSTISTQRKSTQLYQSSNHI